MKLIAAYICISLFFVLLRGKLFYRLETRRQTAFNSIRVCAEMFALTWIAAYFTGNPPPSTKHVLFAAILWGAIFAWKFVTFKKTGAQPSCKWSFAFPISLFIILFVRISAIWTLRTFPVNDVESVITTLDLPLDGFTAIFVKSYLLRALLPIVALTAVLSYFFGELCSVLRKPRATCAVLTAVGVIAFLALFIEKVPVSRYIDAIQNETAVMESDLLEKYFIDADSLHITAPEKPRNLIWILMESMESTFADTASGGEAATNYIPEITQLFEKNTGFSHSDRFGGGNDMLGSRNTITGTFSKTTGIPLLSRLRLNNKFIPGAKSFWESLHKYGYTNYFVMGTDSRFNMQNWFLEQHGVDVIYDMVSMKSKQDVDEKFRNMRSFEAGLTDRSLYAASRAYIDSIARNGSPFSVSIATINTHFPYGFYDKECLEKPESGSDEDSYKATLRCASREVNEFVEWCQKQDFAENTLIVIVGDHLFPNKFPGKFLARPNINNRKWVTILINPTKNPETRRRQFTSIDIAPTILEAMGFDIAEHRFGLGVSLYSEEKTLLEIFGADSLEKELQALAHDPKFFKQFVLE